jgi:hypothetical protein
LKEKLNISPTSNGVYLQLNSCFYSLTTTTKHYNGAQNMRDEEIIDHLDVVLNDIKEIEAQIDLLESKRKHLLEEYEDEMIARHGWAWPFSGETA